MSSEFRRINPELLIIKNHYSSLIKEFEQCNLPLAFRNITHTPELLNAVPELAFGDTITERLMRVLGEKVALHQNKIAPVQDYQNKFIDVDWRFIDGNISLQCRQFLLRVYNDSMFQDRVNAGLVKPLSSIVYSLDESFTKDPFTVKILPIGPPIVEDVLAQAAELCVNIEASLISSATKHNSFIDGSLNSFYGFFWNAYDEFSNASNLDFFDNRVLSTYYLIIKAIEQAKENPKKLMEFKKLANFHAAIGYSLYEISDVEDSQFSSKSEEQLRLIGRWTHADLGSASQNYIFSDEQSFSHPVVCNLILNGGNNILLQKRKSKFLNGYWEFPGGHQRMGETGQETAVRETKEELNIETNPAYLGETSYTDPENINLLTKVYKSNLPSNPLPLLNNEVEDFQFISFFELCRMVEKGNIQVTPVTQAILNIPSVVGYFLALKRYGSSETRFKKSI